MVPASNFCGVSPLGCKPSICDTSGVAGPSTCSVVGWWTWRFSGGWLVGLVDILPTGKDSKRRYGFLGGELKMRTFVVSRVFRCWEEMFEAHKVTIFWTLRIRKPLKTGCLQGPDPCYTGSNTSIAGYLGILREHWYFYQKKLNHPHSHFPPLQASCTIDQLEHVVAGHFCLKTQSSCYFISIWLFTNQHFITEARNPNKRYHQVCTILYCPPPTSDPKIRDCAQGILTTSF